MPSCSAVQNPYWKALPPEAPPKNPTLVHLGNMIDLSSVKSSTHTRVVHQLRFINLANKIESGFPNLYVAKPIRIKKGELVKLA
jgi:hypothetical protein